MSSDSQHQQHLTSADMSMISRVHAQVCVKNSILAGSLDAGRVAALLVREFQYGVNHEADLLAAFTADGAFRLSVPVDRIDQFISNALDSVRSRDEAAPH